MSLLNKQQQERLTATQQIITTGSATTLANAKGPIQVLVNPAATLSAHAITFPATPVDGQTVSIVFGGTMTSGVVVTSTTVVANTGQGVIEPAAPGSKSAGTALAYRYNLANTKWYRLY